MFFFSFSFNKLIKLSSGIIKCQLWKLLLCFLIIKYSTKVLELLCFCCENIYFTDHDGQSRRFSKVSLDNRDISIEIEKSWFSLDELSQDRTFWSWSRFFETCRDFCDFSGFLDIFLDLDREITWFLIYLDRDIYLSCRNLWWVRMLPKVSLEKSR
jgi:hypothetical protein